MRRWLRLLAREPWWILVSHAVVLLMVAAVAAQVAGFVADTAVLWTVRVLWATGSAAVVIGAWRERRRRRARAGRETDKGTMRRSQRRRWHYCAWCCTERQFIWSTYSQVLICPECTMARGTRRKSQR